MSEPDEVVLTFDGHFYCAEHLPDEYGESDLVFGVEREPCEICAKERD